MSNDIEMKEYLDTRGKVTLEFKTPKSKTTYFVYKTEDGFPFYGVKLSKGTTPKELSGRYTKLEWAKDAVLSYLNNMKKSTTVVRDENTAVREARKVVQATAKA